MLLISLLIHFFFILTSAQTTLTNDFNSVGTDTTTTSELLALGHRWRIQDQGNSNRRSNWLVDNGKLKQNQGSCDANYNSLLLTGGGGKGWSDYCVSIKIIPDNNGCSNFDSGIILRHVDERNYYRVSHRRESNIYKITLDKITSSSESRKVETTISSGTSSKTLMACVAGKYISIFRGTTDVSTTPLLKFKDDTNPHLNGAVGLACRGRPCVFEDDFIVTAPPQPFKLLNPDALGNSKISLPDGSGYKGMDIELNAFYRHGSFDQNVYVDAGSNVRVVSSCRVDQSNCVAASATSSGGSVGALIINAADAWKRKISLRASSNGMALPILKKVVVSLHPFASSLLSTAAMDAVATTAIFSAHSVNRTMDWMSGDGFCARSGGRVCSLIGKLFKARQEQCSCNYRYNSFY